MGNKISVGENRHQQIDTVVRENPENRNQLIGTIVLSNLKNQVLDRVYEFFGEKVSFRLISATNGDPDNGNKGRVGEKAKLKKWSKKAKSGADVSFEVTFDWGYEMGEPGAFIIKNHHHTELYIKCMTLIRDPGIRVHFECNSWVYPSRHYKNDRIFFSNQAYRAEDTPETLRTYREQELVNLRGNGLGKLKEWDRVYDYACYNDLGLPDKGIDHARPVIGGSDEYPYPRRGRTGRPPTKSDPNTESRLPPLSLNIYVPRDEQFSQTKMSEFQARAIKSVGQVLLSEKVESVLSGAVSNFQDISQITSIFNEGLTLPDVVSLKRLRGCVPHEIIDKVIRSGGDRKIKLDTPLVNKNNVGITDEDFAREMLAGENPAVIQLLKDFPPLSKLDSQVYGNQRSSMTEDQIESAMDGLTFNQAKSDNKLFILDHHDAIMPYLRRINETSTKTYASRTVLLLQKDGTLKPLAIELSLPHQDGDLHGCTSQVYTRPSDGSSRNDFSIWRLAKAYVQVNDSGYHQIVSHWLYTHAVIEPFIIATHRQMSVLHPIHKLLHPHFRDTMHINALARHIFINAGGVLEKTVFPARYAMQMSSSIYKSWNLMDQALPTDLEKRGISFTHSSQSALQLHIPDYPYAVDGLEVWYAIENWVREYCVYYYPEDHFVVSDSELQSWWTEVRTEGHRDLQQQPWWPTLDSTDSVINVCAILIWIASGHHTALTTDFYNYAAFIPHRPALSREHFPEVGTPRWVHLNSTPHELFLAIFCPRFESVLASSVIECVSYKYLDDKYLGTRNTEWTKDKNPNDSFASFTKRLSDIRNSIKGRNKETLVNNRLRNRKGAIFYTSLRPRKGNDEEGVEEFNVGILNSCSM